MYMLNGNDLELFFRKFALIKILATESKVVENQDSFLVRNFSGKTPTSLGMTKHLFGSAGFNNKIIAEVRVMTDRFNMVLYRAAAHNPGQEIIIAHQWLDKHLEHCRKFFNTYSTFAGELNEINQKMINALGFGICAGSIAQAAAELAAILLGVGLPAGRLVKFVPATLKEIGLRAALGFEIGYSISVVEEWGKAGTVDVMALNFKEGDAIGTVGAGVGTTADVVGMAMTNNESQLTKIANNTKSKAMPALNRNAKIKLDQKVAQNQAPIKSQQTKLGGAAKSLTALNYLLAVKGTYDTLDKCVKHCNFEL